MVDVWTETSSGTRFAQFAWWDGRLINTEQNVGHDIYGQKYDLSTYTIGENDWTVYLEIAAGSSGNIDLNTHITEWDGVEKASSGTEKTNQAVSAGTENSWTFAEASSQNPQETDITMRRLMVEVEYTSGTGITINYGGSAAASADSRLTTGTVIPERGIPLIFLALFLPRIIQEWERRRKWREKALAYAKIETMTDLSLQPMMEMVDKEERGP